MFLWGQRIWVSRPISNIKSKGPGRGGKRPRMTKEDPKLLGEIVESMNTIFNVMNTILKLVSIWLLE